MTTAARSLSLPQIPSSDLLNAVRVASPCPADWNAMDGDDRSRHCAQCDKRVYNLSAMSASEAETFIRQATGRVCVRLYRRADGTVMTSDCPVGLAAVRARAARLAGRVAAAIALSASAAAAMFTRSRTPDLREMEPFASLAAWLTPASARPIPPVMGKMVMGEMACPVQPPQPQPNTQPAPDPIQIPSDQ